MVNTNKEIMDGRKASRVARDYFYEMHGEQGVVAFRIENVSTEEPLLEESVWVIECSFYPSLLARERDYYKVKVSRVGEVLRVEKILVKPGT